MRKTTLFLLISFSFAFISYAGLSTGLPGAVKKQMAKLDEKLTRRNAALLLIAQTPTVPSNLTAVAVSSCQINLSWTASTDDIAVTSYKIYRDGGATPIAAPTGTTYSDTGLAASTTYSYTISACDGAGNCSARSAAANATTSAPPDTQAPTVPTNLTAVAVSSCQINLSWTVSTDNIAVTSYRIYRDGVGTPIATPTGTTYSNTGLVAVTAYSYTVSACDGAGNCSAQSPAVSTTTPDTQAPTVPTNLTAVAVSSSQINLSWTASADDVGVTSYKIFRDGNATPIATPTGTTYSNTGLTASTAYSYTVSACDAAGNCSAQSSVASDTTQPPPVAGGEWVLVIGSAALGTSNFYVMKYEAKNVGGMATSQAAVTPWVYIDQTAAVAACSALGSGYHLLTIPEAQTINRDIEAQAVNWADGTIGSLVSGGGGLKRGNVGIGDSASYSIGAAADYGVAPSADRILKAKLVLSNGGELWDWSGNVWEWIYGAGASGTLGTPGGVTFDVTTWYEWNSAASPDLSQERPVLGPSNSGWTGSYGVGSYWGGATNKAVVRGGNWTHGALAGVFALYSNSNMSDSTVDFGFRCSWTTTDAQAPSVPTNLAAVAVSSNQINLSWAASYDNIGVTSYKIYRNGGGTPIATPTGTAYSDTGLTPSTTYSYTVSACDAAGNCSAQSSAASSVVPSGNITIAPGFGIFFETGQVLAAASNPDMRNGPPDTINFRPTGFGAGEVMYKIIPGCTGISNIASVDTTGYTSPAGPTGSAVTGDCYAVYLPNATYAAFEITGVSPMLISYKYQPNGTNLF